MDNEVLNLRMWKMECLEAKSSDQSKSYYLGYSFMDVLITLEKHCTLVIRPF